MSEAIIGAFPLQMRPPNAINAMKMVETLRLAPNAILSTSVEAHLYLVYILRTMVEIGFTGQAFISILMDFTRLLTDMTDCIFRPLHSKVGYPHR